MFYLKESVKILPRSMRSIQTEKMNNYLLILQKKADEFKKRKESDALTAVNQLNDSLNQLKNKYCNNEILLPEFKRYSLKAVEKAQKTLAIHRGWGEYFVNLKYFITTIGIGYLRDAISQATFFPVKIPTDAQTKADSLSHELQNLQCQEMMTVSLIPDTACK